MKKNFVKKLSVALALAMTVSTLAPAAGAEAAAAPGFKSKSVTVNAGQTKKYSTANSKKYSVKFKIGNKEVATIKYSKGSKSVKVTGVTAGKTTLRADFKSYKTKKVTTKKIPVTVKAVTLAIKGDDNFTTAVNEKYALTAEFSGKTSAKVEWSVAGEGAAVDANGVFTATKTGEYTVTATAKAGNNTVATAEQKVVVKDVVLKSVTQTKANELTVVYAGDISKVKTTDITITRADNVVVPVSKITADKADKTKATLTTFSDMTDGKDYTVKYGEATFSFKATDGKVTSIVIDPVTVPYNTETEINVLGKDANGVEVFKVNKATAGSKKVELNIETTQGYVADNKLVLLEKGNTAKATATLHTYEYNTDGTEKDVIKTEATITAVDPEAVSIGASKYTVAKVYDEKKPVNNKISVKDSGYSLFFELKNGKDEVITKDYTKVESSDTNVLLVGDVSSADLSQVELFPVKEGTAYVLVKDAKDNVVASFAVTVVAERKATSLVLDKNSVTLSNSVASGSGKDEVTVKVTAKDQFGEDMQTTVAAVTAKDVASNKIAPGATYTGNKVTFTATKGAKPEDTTTEGSYVFEIKANDLTRRLNVTVKKVDDASKAPYTYKLDLGTTKVDTTINASDIYDADSFVIAPSVTEYKEGVKVGTVTVDEVILKDSKGEIVSTGAAIATTGKITVATVASNASGSSIITKNLEPGSYTVAVKFQAKNNAKPGKTIDSEATAGFVVEDNQAGVTYTVKKKNVSEGDLTAAVKNENNVEFRYNGRKEDVTVVSAKAGVVNGNQNAAIKVTVQIYVGGHIVNTIVSLNQTLTLNQ